MGRVAFPISDRVVTFAVSVAGGRITTLSSTAAGPGGTASFDVALPPAAVVNQRASVDIETTRPGTETAATGPAPWNYPVLIGTRIMFVVAMVLHPIGTLAVSAVGLSVTFVVGTGFKAVAAYAGGRALRKQEIATLESLLAEANELPGRHRLSHAAPDACPMPNCRCTRSSSPRTGKKQ